MVLFFFFLLFVLLCFLIIMLCPFVWSVALTVAFSLRQDFQCHFQGCRLGSVLRSRLEPVLLVRLGQHGAHSCPSIAGLQLNQKALTTFPDVVLVRVPTPSVQSDSDITVLRHLEKLGCRLVNRPQSILNCVNKFWTFQELAGHGVPMPDTFSYGECPWAWNRPFQTTCISVFSLLPKRSSVLLVFSVNLFMSGN